MNISLSEGRSFDTISQLYDSARISYPASLVYDILMYSCIGKKGTILDVGCGQVTLLFSQRNYTVLGVDVSFAMVHLARKKMFNL